MEKIHHAVQTGKAPGAPINLAFAMAFNQVRDLNYSLWTVALPPLVLLGMYVFAGFGPDGNAETAGVLVYLGIATASVNMPIAHHAMKEAGVFGRVSLAPRSGGKLATGALVGNGLLMVFSGAVVVGLSLALGVRIMSPVFFIAWFAGLVAFSLSLGSLMILFAKSLLAAKNIGNVIMLVLLAGSGMFFEFREPALRIIHFADPAYWLFKVGESVLASAGPDSGVFIPFTVTLVLFVAASVVAVLVRGRRDAH